MNDLKSKIALLRRQVPFIPKTFRLVWRAMGMWMLVWLIMLIAQGVFPVAIVYVMRRAVDSLVGVVKQGNGIREFMVSDVLLPFAILGLLLVFQKVLGSGMQWIRTIQSERIQDYMTGLIHDQALAVDLSYYDSPAYYDRLHRARVDARSRPLQLLEGLGSLGQNGITMTGMAVLLMSYSYWIPLLLLAGTLPALGVTLRYAVRFNDWRLRNTVEERRCNYFDWLLTMREAAPEIRLFDLGRHYRETYQLLRGRLRGDRIALEQGQLIAQFGAGSLALMATSLAMLWMILRTAAGRASVGDVVLFYQAFSQGQGLMTALLGNTSETYKNILFLENLFEFLGIQPKVRDPEFPLPVPVLHEEVRCENVSFRYPETDRMILQELSLTLKSGEIAALVGENGEGKTTLIKLLCRFYDPEKGSITVDGCDLRDLRQADWRREITVLFQEPVRYHLTAAENIAQGDLASSPPLEKIERAARTAGAHDTITRLPKGYDTILGGWFGGLELSTGEWQRVASARAFLRKAKLIILDEPTSMMDAWAEAEWFSRFRIIAAGCTVLLISHRLSTTMHADVIHVMRGGRIIESGTHADLLLHGGRYREAWESQNTEAASRSILKA